MELTERLVKYSELLITHGLNVQLGQQVSIAAESIHRDFCVLLTDAAYRAGASYVNVDLIEPRIESLRVIHSTVENLDFVPEYLAKKYADLVDTQAANLRLVGSENPDLFSTLDSVRLNRMRQAQRKALKYFYEEGIGKSKVHWTVAAAATPQWAVKVFPDLPEDKATLALWNSILDICRIDSGDVVTNWKRHNVTLQARAKMLTDLKIEKLHFFGGGTDLVVGLSDRAIFKGGGDNSPRGVHFEPNIPTEEVFTTPDYRKTEGVVRATRPFLINGKMIRDLVLEFKDGEISSFSASEGEDTFSAYINSDEGAKRLGEVALVGTDSPVFKSGRVFEEILFDENAACHIAVGLAYKFCLEGGESLTEADCEAIGCNVSAVHTDMMISNEEVSVSAKTFDGKDVSLIESGAWVI